VILSIITRKADIVLVTMSWVFVVTRLVHASIHTTSNKIAWRFQAFALGVVILMLMWIIFAVRIVFAEAGL